MQISFYFLTLVSPVLLVSDKAAEIAASEQR
jgi:hypothetical protein